MFAASNIVAFTHPYENTFSNPLIRSNEGLALKTSAFQYVYGSTVLVGHLSMRQILLVLHLSKRYVGSLRGDLDMILQRRCEMMEV